MVTVERFRSHCLAFPQTMELPHFDLVSFRVNNKIFATLSIEKQRVMLKLSPVDQSVFCSFDKNIIYAVPGAWGKEGCTFFELKKVKIEMLKDGIKQAYCNVAPKSILQKFNLKTM